MSAISFGNNFNSPFVFLRKAGERGISLIEIMTATFVIVIGLVGFLTSMAFSLRASVLTRETTIADNLAQEALEAVRSYRDGTDWETDGLGLLNTGESFFYHPQLAEGKWLLSEGSETINDFSRKIIFDKVSRDPVSENIEKVYNPANDDPETIKVRAIISWGNRDLEIITYLTDWKQWD